MNPGKVRILIVDDNPSIHDDIRRVLGTAPQKDTALDALEQELFGTLSEPKINSTLPVYEISSAFQGEEGFKMANEQALADNPFSLIFMDMRMPPGWDGLETIQKIWEKWPETEIVINSAYTDYSWNEINTRLGSSDHLLFLKKPFEPMEIQQIALALSTKWTLSKKLKEHLQNLEKEVLVKTNELELQRSKSFQAEKMASLGTLAGGMAHEINTPLTTLGLVSEELLEIAKAGDPAWNSQLVQDRLTLIQKTTDKIARIISGIRTFSRDGSKDPFSMAPVKAIVDDSLVLCESRLKSKEVSLEVEPFSADLQLLCRPTEICQLLLNLLNNSIDEVSSLRPRWIKMSVRPSLGWVEFRISDSGKGIAAQNIKRIFDPFFTTKEVGKGTGLGLSISRGIVESHGGTIFVDEKCQNTTFVVQIKTKTPQIG